MRIGLLILPTERWPAAAEQWRNAEELGFDHAWTFDHLAWRDLIDRPWYATIPTLAAAATVTKRIQLGTLVASPNFRHPFPLAHEIMTLDEISEGRVILGLGAGAATEAGVLGKQSVDRSERFAEFIQLMDSLLRRRITDFSGRHYSAHEAVLTPGCRQRPRVRLAIAASGPKGMQLAARYGDIWVTNGRSTGTGMPPFAEPAIVTEQTSQLYNACAVEHRDPATLRIMVLVANRMPGNSSRQDSSHRLPLGTQSAPFFMASVDSFEELVAHYAARGVSDLIVPYPRPEPPFAGDLSILRRIAEKVLPRWQDKKHRDMRE